MVCPVALAATARLRVADTEGLFAALPHLGAHYVCAESAESFEGIPLRDRTSDFRHWEAKVVDGTRLCLDTYPGTLLIIR